MSDVLTEYNKTIPGDQGMSEGGKDPIIIGSTTSVQDIISALAKRGCLDLTPSMDIGSCSELPLDGGGFCDVYRGTMSNGTKIAIKSLRLYDRPGMGNEKEKVLKRASRELYHWSRLKHPNVLPLMGLATFRGHMSMISEWMDNGNLMSYVRVNPDANRISLCMDICAGLTYIHANDMVHGDLKAANVMISRSGIAMIADFGNSQLKDLTLKFSNTMGFAFSFRWAAPEILLAEAIPQLSKKADVYAYGMTALEALTGQVPYEGITEKQLMIRVLNHYEAPARPKAGMNDGLWEILQSCWTLEPSKRPEITTIRQQLGALFPRQLQGTKTGNRISTGGFPWPLKFRTQLGSTVNRSIDSASDIDFPGYHTASSSGQPNSGTAKDQQLESEPSHLGRTISLDSFYTVGAGSNTSQLAGIEDLLRTIPGPDREDAAKTFAERAWQEDPSFVEREKLAEWFGSPSSIIQQALGHYVAYFDFSNSDVDESIRALCKKLYVRGATKQIDRILEAFSEHYISQNSSSVWRLTDVVHVVSFAIILLNTDLHATELDTHITSSRFVDNTVEAIRTQINQVDAVPNAPTSTDNTTTSESPVDTDTNRRPVRPFTYRSPFDKANSLSTTERGPSGTRVRSNSVTSGPMPLGRDSWVLASASSDGIESLSETLELDERWITELSRELASIYKRIRDRPILQARYSQAATPSLSALRTTLVSTLGRRVSLSMSSVPQLFGLSFKSSSLHSMDTVVHPVNSPWAKTGPLLWKSVKPAPQRMAKSSRWLSVTATVRNGTFEMLSAESTPSGSNPGAGRRLGALSLLHALTHEVPAPKGAKFRSFGLTLASGETHMFEIQGVSSSILSKNKSKSGPDPDAEVLAWVRACNYHAARYSRAPLPDAVTNVEYGWNGAGVIEDDQSATSDGLRNALIDDWVAPTLPHVEAQTDLEAQLDAWNRQVEMYNTDFAEHGELRGRMMGLYRPGSAQAQKALSNWEKKAQYLLTEIVKYETYAEILKNAE